MSRILASVLALSASVFAHIQPGSLTIQGGTSHVVGEHVSLSWSASIDHNLSSYTLWYSSDAGKSWTTVKSGIPGKASGVAVVYDWTVPGPATTTGMIRVFQVFGGTVATDPAKPGEYTLFSPALTIQAASANSRIVGEGRQFSRLRRMGNLLEIRFDGLEQGLATLEILDMDGTSRSRTELGAVVVGRQPTRISLDGKGLRGAKILRLRSNGFLVAQTVVAVLD